MTESIIIAEAVFPLKLSGAMVSALLLWASFFPEWGGLVWFALVPLFAALLGETRRGRGAIVGGVFGLTFFLLEAMGLLELRIVAGTAGAVLAFGSVGFLGVAWGALLGALAVRGGVPRLVGLWVLLELLRASGPWGIALGTTPLVFAGTFLIRTVAFGGPWLLALAVAATNASAAALFLTQKRRWLAVAAAGPLTLGALALTWDAPDPHGELKVALVQPGITAEERMRVSPAELLHRYEALLATVPEDADLIVLPEDVLPVILRQEPSLFSAFRGEAQRLGVPLLLGSWDLDGGRFYNTAFLLRPLGEVEIIHRKVRLLPFGEYLPLRWLWERLGLKKLVEKFLPREISRGEGLTAFGRYGILICSESQFPRFTQALARDGAEVILVLTNDSWFGASRILWEHFACGALRAAETGRVFLQAAITGITGGFGPDGRPLGTLPKVKKGVLTLKIPLHFRRTPYMDLGDWPIIGLCFLFLLVPAITSPSRRNPRRPVHGGHSR